MLNWNQYKKRKWMFILAVPLTFLAPILVGLFSNGALPFIAFFGGAIFFLFPVGFRYITTPCPNCEQPIHLVGAFGYPFGPKCLHCGIKVGQSSESDQ